MIGFSRHPEQCVLDHNACVIARHMGKLQPARDVTDGKNFLVGRPQPNINVNAFRRIGNASRFKIKPVHVGAPPGRNQ